MDKYIKFIDDLIRLTQSNQIQWSALECPPSDLKIDPNSEAKEVYTADFKQKQLRIYIETYKNHTDAETYYYAQRYNLELIKDFSITKVPSKANMMQLFEMITQKCTAIDSFIDEISQEIKVKVESFAT